MLDHVFMDCIGVLRHALTEALLERQAFEERLQTDILLGDLTWETSYGLPGEGLPPRVRADLTLEWPTWSQAAYRSWYGMGEVPEDPPELVLELVLRVQRLAEVPDMATVMTALPDTSLAVGPGLLERSGPTIEVEFDDDLAPVSAAVEVTYDGIIPVEEDVLVEPSRMADPFAALGGWVAGTLVRLGDLKLSFLPADDEQQSR